MEKSYLAKRIFQQNNVFLPLIKNNRKVRRYSEIEYWQKWWEGCGDIESLISQNLDTSTGVDLKGGRTRASPWTMQYGTDSIYVVDVGAWRYLRWSMNVHQALTLEK